LQWSYHRELLEQDNAEELKTLVPILMQHFKRLGMQKHVGTNKTVFPKTLKEAIVLNKTDSAPPPNTPLPDSQHIQFTKKL
jgi:hypothetical protein